jgi:hypothetical protein
MDRLSRNGQTDEGNKKNRYIWRVFLLITCFFVISIFIRQQTLSNISLWSFHDGESWWNDEVTGHFIGVLSAFDQLPASNHFFMPISAVSRLEAGAGKKDSDITDLFRGIESGAFAADRSGNALYISFPPAGFFMVHMLFSLLHVDPSPLAIAVLNISLQIISALLLAVLIHKTIGRRAGRHGWIITSFAASAYVFALEVMHSHAIPFWSHQILQPLFLLSVLATVFWREHRFKPVVLFLLAFLMAMTEWTGFLIGLSMALVLFLKDRSWGGKSRPLNEAMWVWPFLGIAFAGFAIVALNAWRVGFGQYLTLLNSRFNARTNAGEKGLLKFGQALMGSFGPYVWALAFLAFCALIRTDIALRRGDFGYRKILSDWKRKPQYTMVLLLLSLPLLENFLMNEHAITYTFDRLKWILLLAFLLALTAVYLTAIDRWWLYVFVAVMVLAGLMSSMRYLEKYDLTSPRIQGVPLGVAACQYGMRNISEYIARTSSSDEAVFISSRAMPILEFPYQGDVPIGVDDMSEARKWLSEYGWSRGKLYVVGGRNFDFEGDYLPLGDVSAVIVLNEPGGASDGLIRRADPAWDFVYGAEEFPVFNWMLKDLLVSGMEFIAPDGRRFSSVGWQDNRLLLDGDVSDIDELRFSLSGLEDIEDVPLDVFNYDTPVICERLVDI